MKLSIAFLSIHGITIDSNEQYDILKNTRKSKFEK
jgi:hypothetical protein